jgi:fused signal recognition particle receptor
VTVRSSLDTLEQLRQRAHEAEQSRLAAQAEAERSAEAEQERARQVLLAATSRHEATRREEDHRLIGGGITAAEGERRALWESAQRQRQALLWKKHEHAVDSCRAAASKHEQARASLCQADAELRQVRERIERDERAKRRGEEQAQQENLDESSLRRFLERNGA